MKNAVKLIKGFLESKGIEWDCRIKQPNEFVSYGFIPAQDHHFDGYTMRNMLLQRGKDSIELSLLINKQLFMVFKVFNSRRIQFESDFSQEWQNYLENVNENESENENI